MLSSRYIGTTVFCFLLIAPLSLFADTLIPFTTEPVLADPDDEIHPPVAEIKTRDDLDGLWNNMSIHFYNNVSYVNEHAFTFLWNFGDGSEQTKVPDPVHEYEEPGFYTVTLIIYGEQSTYDMDTLEIWVQRNYGDTEIIIKAMDWHSSKTFRDPGPDQMSKVAVQRGGWVAYLCDLKADDRVEVKVTVVGDRPADVFLFKEEEFQAYKDGPEVDFVQYVIKGTKTGTIGEFFYHFRAERTERYYVVIDNRDWPQGTDATAPVDYTISITPIHETGPPPRDIWDILCNSWTYLIGFGLVLVVLKELNISRKERVRR
jgi:PKD repeat protein